MTAVGTADNADSYVQSSSAGTLFGCPLRLYLWSVIIGIDKYQGFAYDTERIDRLS